MKRSQILLLCGAALLGGCLSKPSLVKESFAFNRPPPANSDVNPNAPVLALRKVFVAPPFDSQPFTYRSGEFSFERDPYAGFLVPPAESLAEPTRQYLRNTGLFRDVIEPDSSLKPDLQAEISLTQLYGDFSNRAKPEAVLNLRFVVFENGTGAPEKVLLQKSYARSIALSARTAPALMGGWNEALKQIMGEISADLKPTLE